MTKSTKSAAKQPARSAARSGSADRRGSAGSSRGENASRGGDGGKIAKTQIIDMVAERTSLNKKQAGDAVATMLDCVVSALRSGQSVGLPGLGTLSVAQTAERSGVRPGTSERITIPAGKKVRFKVATTLKGGL
ncbi:HU family DNA-binding protein [Deinococcus multiflagellatus]|uniref:HU family DNA-binding protein n=1 Tax=Deinococcus multiflagellatus TaxID=1656887 RepID=UPI001CCBECF3|nr:HU family DNA-binding protein [Deinococcus multiflagellatus]MBZ9714846.1 HU family DNA-binding protein [Deinococcus multiflagellatus]